MSNKHLYNFGQFLIWGDFYLVYFFVHSLFIDPMNTQEYTSQYFGLAYSLFNLVSSWGGLFEWYIQWVLTWPATLLFFLRFTFTTSIGIWLVRRFG